MMGDSFDGTPLADERNEFLEQTRVARQKRATEQRKGEAILVIQRFFRTLHARRILIHKATEQFDVLMAQFVPDDEVGTIKAVQVFHAANLLMKLCGSKVSVEALEKICRYVIWSSKRSNPTFSYIGCGMNKDTAVPWIHHLKDLVTQCLRIMTTLKPELVSDSKLLSLFLTTILNLTSLDKWTILQRSEYGGLVPGMQRLNATLFSHMKTNGNLFGCMHSVLQAGLARPGMFFIKKTNLLAMAKMINIAVKKEDDNINPEVLNDYVYKILTVPAYVYYVNSQCPEGLEYSWLPEILNRILKNESMHLTTDLSSTLAMLANLIHLGQCSGTLATLFYPDFAAAISKLLIVCGKQGESVKKSHWHPILGWVEHPVPSSLLNAVSVVKTQIEYLWGPVYLEAIFHPLRQYLQENNLEGNEKEEVQKNSTSVNNNVIKQGSGGVFKHSVFKAFRKAFGPTPAGSVGNHHVKFSADITTKISESCELFSNVITTFSTNRLDILTGLCFKHSSMWLVSLWKFIQMLGKDVRCWVDALLSVPKVIQESLILMFADAMVHYITMLDDQEMYEDQLAFTLAELAKIGQFVNYLCYRLITNTNSGRLRETTWTSLKTLLIVLYRRDCRRKYCPDDHWLIESSKMQQLICDIEKGRKHAKRVLLDMPHVLREDARVILFRKWAASEKTLTGNSNDADLTFPSTASTLITIQRGRIVEDGYAQLASLSPKALKGTIRVRFQNEYGLDEAGIDQDGVFKEFLEETISAVFNPSLNLFKGTSENLLYPSPLSYLHDNHLQLFEFVGKILAKAIYEGIVVDVHFAPFFLCQILGYQQNALFSAIDELQSLDRDLYNSLNFIKHHEGNVEDLELTFSVDQDCLGEIKTIELTPGGRLIPVTNQNKISYLYLMAHYHLYVQIKDQTNAFLKGFRSIIPNEWIRIFSPPELQRLISGEDTDIDLNDLRRNTQYYGGFHDNHRVIIWLWEILENDFSERERRLFLKFVTSCSKPPLLGFANLDPPFSIRCVEVSDDEDTGDTIGSVLRGFLTIGKRSPAGRLPTSSTCFNLLKLPNYQKKATLREKLRYAITSNVGFELS